MKEHVNTLSHDKIHTLWNIVCILNIYDNLHNLEKYIYFN